MVEYPTVSLQDRRDVYADITAYPNVLPLVERPKDSVVRYYDIKIPDLRTKVVSLMRDGEVIGGENRSVFALFGDATNNRAFQTIVDLKGEARLHRPVALATPADQMLEMIDFNYVDPRLHKLFSNPDTFSARFGSLTFWRLPIKSDIAESLRSSGVTWVLSDQVIGDTQVPYMQLWDPDGTGDMAKLIEDARLGGIEYVMVTSMNCSGKPEITSADEADVFAKRRGLEHMVYAPDAKFAVAGSYTAYGVSPNGLELIRDGNIPHTVLSKLILNVVEDPSFNITVDNPKVIPHQQQIPLELIQGLTPEQSRERVIGYVLGQASVHQ